eukprot:Nk52_evm1s762 gene=Nk52_evmTU1s762
MAQGGNKLKSRKNAKTAARHEQKAKQLKKGHNMVFAPKKQALVKAANLKKKLETAIKKNIESQCSLKAGSSALKFLKKSTKEMEELEKKEAAKAAAATAGQR